MEKIIFFDYCAFVLVVILFITTISRKMIWGRQNTFFIYLTIVIMLNIVADIYAVNFDRMGPGNVTGKYIAHFVYLFFHMCVVPCYVAYLISVADLWHIFRSSRLRTVLLFVPLAVGAVLMMLNPFTDKIFYLDGTDTYTRGDWFVSLYIIAFIYMVVGLKIIFSHRKQFGLSRIISLLSVFVILGVVALIQFLNPNIVLEMFAVSSALVFISMMLQRPEDLIDAETGLGKLSAYVTHVQNASLNSKHMEIIMVNIVNFGLINEMLGYQNYTKIRQIISNELIAFNKNRRLDSELFYLGQGKYRIVMDRRHYDKIQSSAELLCRALRPGVTFNGITVDLVVNVCIARFPEDIDNVDSLLSFGRDLHKIPYTGSVLYAAEHFKKEYYDIKKDIDIIIEEALANKRFEVYYQPIYAVMEKRFNSAEALLRLKTEKYGFISPEIFIPAAEKSGAIHKIGKFVMDEVCKFIAGDEFKKLGLDYIEINLSVSECMQVNLADDILETIDRYGVRRDQINLEITETAASYSQQVMMDNLNALNKAGISFSLDDFGTGYSNMRRIVSLPLSIVKLDKSFTNLKENSKFLIVLENTIHMIKDMHMKIVVEGVETENMVKMFSGLECEYIQGYYYSKPLPQKDFVEFIYNKKA